MKWYQVRNPIRDREWLQLSDTYEYPVWVFEREHSTMMPLWKAAAYAQALQPHSQQTPLEVIFAGHS